MIDVVDNFLSNDHHKLALTLVESQSTLWQCTPILNDDNINVPLQYNRQLTHRLYGTGSPIYHAILIPILQQINVSSERLIRAKINNNLATEEIREHGFHVDTDKECNVAIYYFNTNNGYTLFENGDKVDSIGNRLIMFRSNLRHTGTTCTDKPNRYVLNINYT